jgi:hypothetical protein
MSAPTQPCMHDAFTAILALSTQSPSPFTRRLPFRPPDAASLRPRAHHLPRLNPTALPRLVPCSHSPLLPARRRTSTELTATTMQICKPDFLSFLSSRCLTGDGQNLNPGDGRPALPLTTEPLHVRSPRLDHLVSLIATTLILRLPFTLNIPVLSSSDVLVFLLIGSMCSGCHLHYLA